MFLIKFFLDLDKSNQSVTCHEFKQILDQSQKTKCDSLEERKKQQEQERKKNPDVKSIKEMYIFRISFRFSSLLVTLEMKKKK